MISGFFKGNTNIQTRMDIKTPEKQIKVDTLLQHRKRVSFQSPLIKQTETLGKNREKVEHKTTESGKRGLENSTENNIILRSSKRKKNAPICNRQTVEQAKQEFISPYDSGLMKEQNKKSLPLISHHVLASLDNTFFSENSDDMKTSSSIKHDTKNSQASEKTTDDLISLNCNKLDDCYIVDNKKYTNVNFKEKENIMEESKILEVATSVINEPLKNQEETFSLHTENHQDEKITRTEQKNVSTEQNYKIPENDVHDKNEENISIQYANIYGNVSNNTEALLNSTTVQTKSEKLIAIKSQTKTNEEKIELETTELGKRTSENKKEGRTLRSSKRRKTKKKAQTMEHKKQELNSKNDAILMEEKSESGLALVSKHESIIFDNTFSLEGSDDTKTLLNIKYDIKNNQTSEKTIQDMISSNSSKINTDYHLDDNKKNYRNGNFGDIQITEKEHKKLETTQLILNESIKNDEKVFSLNKEKNNNAKIKCMVQETEGGETNAIIKQNCHFNTKDEIKNEEMSKQNKEITTKEYPKLCEDINENIEAQANNTAAQTKPLKNTKTSNAESQHTAIIAQDQMISLNDETIIDNLESTKYIDTRHFLEQNKTDMLYQEKTESFTDDSINFLSKNINLEQKLSQESKRLCKDENINEESNTRRFEKGIYTIGKPHRQNDTVEVKHSASNASTLHNNIIDKSETAVTECTSNLMESHFEKYNFREDNFKIHEIDKKANYNNSNVTYHMNDKIKQKQVFINSETLDIPTNILCTENISGEKYENLHASKINNSEIASFNRNNTNLTQYDSKKDMMKIENDQVKIIYDESHPRKLCESSMNDEGKNQALQAYKSDLQTNSKSFFQLQLSSEKSEHLSSYSCSTNCVRDDKNCSHKTDEANAMFKKNDTNDKSDSINSEVNKSNIFRANASDKNLQIREKKLSILYTSALDYEKEFNSKQPVSDERRKSSYNKTCSLPCSPNKDLMCNSDICYKENFTKDSIEIYNQAFDVSESNLDAKDFSKDGSKIHEVKTDKDLLNEQSKLYTSETGEDVQQVNTDENLIYDALNMKFTEDLSQLEMNEKNFMNNFTEHYTENVILTYQDKECNRPKDGDKKKSLSCSLVENSSDMTELDNKSLEHNELTSRKVNTDEHQRKGVFQDADEIFLTTAMDCFKKDDIIKDISIKNLVNCSTTDSIKKLNKRKEKEEDNIPFDGNLCILIYLELI